MADARGEEDGALSSDKLSRVRAFSLSLREKHGASCQRLEEEHLDQAIEQEVTDKHTPLVNRSLQKIRDLLYVQQHCCFAWKYPPLCLVSRHGCLFERPVMHEFYFISYTTGTNIYQSHNNTAASPTYRTLTVRPYAEQQHGPERTS